MPDRPSPEKPSRGSWLAIFLAGTLLVGAVLILFVLSLGSFIPVMVIGGLIFMVTGFHYLVWGWWLGGIIRREAEEESWDES